jgi:predicted N-acyltransferase
MTCIEARTIYEIDEKHWDSVTGSAFSMTYRWLCLLETCWQPYEPRYLLLEDNRGAYAVVVSNTVEIFKNRGAMSWLYRHLNLVFNTPCTSRCAVMVRPDISLESAMPELVPAMERLCRKEKRLLMTVSNVNTSDLPAWKRAGFLETAQSSVNVLDLPATYEHYLASLRPKNRAELRRIRKRAKEFDIHFEVGSLTKDGEQIYPLIKEVFMNHAVSRESMPFTLQFLSKMACEIPEQQILIIKGFVGSKLSGVYLCLLNASTLWWLMAGLKHEIARPNYIYFLLMDEMIHWGIEHNVQQIYGGLTNNREKQRHGFRLEERWFCYRTSVRPLDQILALALPLARQLTQYPMKVD